MQHDVNQHLVQTGKTFYKYDAAIILTSLLGRGRLFPIGMIIHGADKIVVGSTC